MTSKLTVAALAALFVVAYAMQPAAAASSSPSDARVAPGKWDVTRVLCSDLLNADDDPLDDSSFLRRPLGIRLLKQCSKIFARRRGRGGSGHEVSCSGAQAG